MSELLTLPVSWLSTALDRATDALDNLSTLAKHWVAMQHQREGGNAAMLRVLTCCVPLGLREI